MSARAQALAPFKKAFQAKYISDSDNDDLKAAFKKASCNTCHIKGKKKTERNAYSMQLEKLIEGNAKERIKEAGEISSDAKKAETATVLAELDKAFDEIAKMDSGDETTYGARIASGELPVDPLKAAAEYKESNPDSE